MATLGTQLAEPPGDGISSLCFSATSDLLLASSWDGTARLYDTERNSSRAMYVHGAPVLDCTFQENDRAILTAGLNCQIKWFDCETGAGSLVGTHEKPVRCVEWLSQRRLAASGSWDCSLRAWDPRLPPGQNCVVLVPVPGKVFSMSHAGDMLAVATSQRQILAFDVRRIEDGQPVIQRESSLKFQTRCLRCFPDAQGFGIASVEGRVAIEYFDESDAAQAKKFAFKCHRRMEDGIDTAYPVNAIAFHPLHGTFATGGCDGVVNVWDPVNKKRLFQVTGYPTSIAALAFKHDGTQLVIASSYTFERGELPDQPADTIFVRQMTESEVKAKPRR